MQIIETEITIHKPLEEVWAVLSDFEGYHRWNPFVPEFKTTKVVGEPVVMTVHMHPGKKPIIQKETMSDFEPPYRMGWVLDWGFLLKTHRIQELKAIDENTTHYYTFDKFWGLLTPLVMALYGKPVQAGFEATAKGLKEFLENGTTTSVAE